MRPLRSTYEAQPRRFSPQAGAHRRLAEPLFKLPVSFLRMGFAEETLKQQG